MNKRDIRFNKRRDARFGKHHLRKQYRDSTYTNDSSGAVAALAEWLGVVQEDIIPQGNYFYSSARGNYTVISGDELDREISESKKAWVVSCINNLPGDISSILSFTEDKLEKACTEWIDFGIDLPDIDDPEIFWFSSDPYEIIDDYYIFFEDAYE